MPHLSPYLAGAAIDNAVALVTGAHGDRQNVMAVTFFAESAHIPPLVRIAIAPTAFTHDLIARSGWFGLSLVARGQEEIALACGTWSGRDGDKFGRLGLSRRVVGSGVPLLPDCLTTSACEVVETADLPGHSLFIGRIRESFRQSRMSHRLPLLVSDLERRAGAGRG